MRVAALSMIAWAGLFTGSVSGSIGLVSSFDPPEGGSINSIAFDHTADEVYVHFNFSPVYHIYDRNGAFLRTLPIAPATGNDDDIDFLTAPAVINGVAVPAGTLLSFANEFDPPRLDAIDKSNGQILATALFDGNAIGQWVGGAEAAGLGGFVAVDWSRDYFQVLDADSGAIVEEHRVWPSGSPEFDIYYGDVDVLNADGNLYFVSSSQDRIRAMSPDGEWGGDFELAPLGVSGMAGIAFDDGRGEAWIGSQNGTVYLLNGFPPPGCVIADLAPPLNILDLDDVVGFANAFTGGQAVADLAPPFGLLDLRDITAFVAAFLAGCP